MRRIHRVNPKQLLDVIDFRFPLGLFLMKEDRLRGKFEVEV